MTIQQKAAGTFAILLSFFLLSQKRNHDSKTTMTIKKTKLKKRKKTPKLRENSFGYRLSRAALQRTKAKVRYDPAYVKIAYPLGDVPSNTGVCTDVLIRSYRTLGVDLQRRVHRDMKKNFRLYPKAWGLKKPDTNIDHRRVLNLKVFFRRVGKQFRVRKKPQQYLPGDIVTWRVEGLPHIGIIVHKKSQKHKGYQVVHNIGQGPMLEDFLFDYKITGHFRYHPKK